MSDAPMTTVLSGFADPVLDAQRCFRAVLEAMIHKFGGGPVGLDTLAAMTGEDALTIEDVYEPYLLQLGFLMRTPRGRVATPSAYEHLKLTPPPQSAAADQVRMALD